MNDESIQTRLDRIVSSIRDLRKDINEARPDVAQVEMAEASEAVLALTAESLCLHLKLDLAFGNVYERRLAGDHENTVDESVVQKGIDHGTDRFFLRILDGLAKLFAQESRLKLVVDDRPFDFDRATLLVPFIRQTIDEWIKRQGNRQADA